MGEEIVSVDAGGKSFKAFEQITVSAALDHAVRHFSMQVAAVSGAAATAWKLKPGTAITIRFSGDVVFKGFVDRYQPQFAGKKKSTIGIAGRAKGQDFLDGAALHDTGRFENQTLLQIAQALDQYGAGFSTDQDLEPIEEYQVTPGETAFSVLRQLARKQGLTLAGEPDGTIKITKAGTVRHAGGLIQGVNIEQASGDLNWSHRHSKIIVRGQKPDGDGETALQVEATAEDSAVGRNRPLVLIEDGDIDQATAQMRADTRRDREAGESLKASVTVQGFRDDADVVWKPGNLVWLESPFLNITQVMLIKHAEFSQSRSGSTTDLTLVDPRSFGGKAGKGGGTTDDAWSIEDEN
jgi:prophage tail gpP-like protein